MIKKLFRNLPYIKDLVKDRNCLLTERNSLLLTVENLKKITPPVIQNKSIQPAFPNGHFYSTIPNFDIELKNYKKNNLSPKTIPAINLNENLQLKTFKKISKYYKTQPFTKNKTRKNLFYFNNPNYLCGDALILYSLIRDFKPKQIYEIGSGYSSCVMLDTNRIFFKNNIKLTFIEPYPQLLLNLISNNQNNCHIIEKKIQEINLDVFKKLNKNDILFIDSTHVSKLNSDVNYIFFEILPALKPGVLIHFHDIFYPFEYPKKWFEMGFAWNEDYILRAFLEYNHNFQIYFFNSFFYTFYRQLINKNMPLILKNTNSSLWLKKI